MQKKVATAAFVMLLAPLFLWLVGLTPIRSSITGWVGGFKSVFQTQEEARSQSCQSNLKLLHSALFQYARDFDGFLPPVSVSNSPAIAPPYLPPFGWADAIQPWIKSLSVYRCPTVAQDVEVDAMKVGYIDYWLNTNAAATKTSNFSAPSVTLLAGEGNDRKDRTTGRYNLISFPAQWLRNTDSPLYRHLGGANYVFVDGHVKWLKPDEVAHFGGRTEPFAPK